MVSNLTTKELVYLEDVCKMFESTMKNCNFASSNAVDPEFKSLMQSMASEHKQWITASIPMATNTTMQ